ncbi:MAG: UbiA family prenyltransferase [Bacteroidales bacterium]
MHGFQNKLVFILRLFRWQEWVFTKFMFNLSLIMAFVLFHDMQPQKIITPALLYLLYMVPAGAFAYLFNDISDIHFDRKADKQNLSDRIKKPYKAVLLCFLLLIAGLPALFVDRYAGIYLLLLGGQVACFVLYSSPRIRFKVNIFGLFCDALFSFVLPGLIGLLLVAQSFPVYFDFDTSLLMLILWLFFTGLRGILSHQIKDLAADRISGQSTFVRNAGLKPSLILRNSVVVVELGLFILLVLLMTPDIQYAILAGLAVFFLFEIFFQNSVNTRTLINPQNLSLFNVFYNYYLFFGFCFIFLMQGGIGFSALLCIFVVCRFYQWWRYRLIDIKTGLKWLYYKVIGLFRRIGKII